MILTPPPPPTYNVQQWTTLEMGVTYIPETWTVKGKPHPSQHCMVN